MDKDLIAQLNQLASQDDEATFLGLQKIFDDCAALPGHLGICAILCFNRDGLKRLSFEYMVNRHCAARLPLEFDRTFFKVATPDAIEIIVKHGFDVNATFDDTAQTPIFLTRGSATQALICRHGANIHDRDAYGNTPLHVNPCPESIRILIDSGVDFLAENYAGRTPMEQQLSQNETSSLAILKALCKHFAFKPIELHVLLSEWYNKAEPDCSNIADPGTDIAEALSLLPLQKRAFHLGDIMSRIFEKNAPNNYTPEVWKSIFDETDLPKGILTSIADIDLTGILPPPTGDDNDYIASDAPVLTDKDLELLAYHADKNNRLTGERRDDGPPPEHPPVPGC